MAAIPREYVDNYVDALASVSDEAKKKLEESLRRIDWTRDVATVRDEIIDVMQVYCGGSTDMAAQLAAEFYDGLREQAIGTQLGAFAESGRNPAATDGAVRAFVQDLVDGKGPDSVIEKCLDRVDYETKKAAATCVTRNANRDPAKPRYARVPAGGETCDFCLMLASRGPVYHSEASAGAVDHFHANCRCQVVPMWGARRVKTKAGGFVYRGGTSVEGYDPDALFDKYLDFATEDFRKRMAKAADKAHTEHDSGWFSGLTKKEMNVLHARIGGATSFEDLIERVDSIDSGSDYMTEKQWNELLNHARRKRKELIGEGD